MNPTKDLINICYFIMVDGRREFERPWDKELYIVILLWDEDLYDTPNEIYCKRFRIGHVSYLSMIILKRGHDVSEFRSLRNSYHNLYKIRCWVRTMVTGTVLLIKVPFTFSHFDLKTGPEFYYINFENLCRRPNSRRMDNMDFVLVESLCTDPFKCFVQT